MSQPEAYMIYFTNQTSLNALHAEITADAQNGLMDDGLCSTRENFA